MDRIMDSGSIDWSSNLHKCTIINANSFIDKLLAFFVCEYWHVIGNLNESTFVNSIFI